MTQASSYCPGNLHLSDLLCGQRIFISRFGLNVIQEGASQLHRLSLRRRGNDGRLYVLHLVKRITILPWFKKCPSGNQEVRDWRIQAATALTLAFFDDTNAISKTPA
jgi:hypothetical protein